MNNKELMKKLKKEKERICLPEELKERVRQNILAEEKWKAADKHAGTNVHDPYHDINVEEIAEGTVRKKRQKNRQTRRIVSYVVSAAALIILVMAGLRGGSLRKLFSNSEPFMSESDPQTANVSDLTQEDVDQENQRETTMVSVPKSDTEEGMEKEEVISITDYNGVQGVEGILLIGNGTVMYYDEEMGQLRVLCDKAGCEHEPYRFHSEDPVCPAAVLYRESNGLFGYSGEYLWYIQKNTEDGTGLALKRTDLSGENAEVIAHISDCQYTDPAMIWTDRHLYVVCHKDSEIGTSEEEKSYSSKIVQVDLKTGEVEVIREKQGSGASTNAFDGLSGSLIGFYNHYVYYTGETCLYRWNNESRQEEKWLTDTAGAWSWSICENVLYYVKECETGYSLLFRDLNVEIEKEEKILTIAEPFYRYIVCKDHIFVFSAKGTYVFEAGCPEPVLASETGSGIYAVYAAEQGVFFKIDRQEGPVYSADAALGRVDQEWAFCTVESFLKGEEPRRLTEQLLPIE